MKYHIWTDFSRCGIFYIVVYYWELSMKFSQYNYIYEEDGKLLILNLKNSKYVCLKDKEQIGHIKQLLNRDIVLSENDKMAVALRDNGYIVEDDINEYSEVKNKLQDYLMQYDKNLSILLYVTEQCNFRCVYCPENHVNKYFSDENWNALYKHVEKGIEQGKYKNINISFFGGEPLLESEKIISFLERLDLLSQKHNDVNFYHRIVTNAYLLTPDIYDKLVDLKVKYYQITVDGLEDVHNRFRPLVGGQGTWSKIIENLKYINNKADDAIILLRTNYNNSTISTMDDWKAFQRENFSNEKFKFDYNTISGFSDKVPQEYIANFSEMSENAVEKGLFSYKEVLRPFANICSAAYPNNYSMSVDGKISKCENLSEAEFFDDIFIGSLAPTGDFVFKDKYNLWFEDFETEDCLTCIAYPLCAARKCPAKKVLYPDTRPDCIQTKNKFANKIEKFIKYNVINKF